MIRVFEAFAGIGTQRMALKNIGVEHEVVGISEIDKFAIKSYMAIHGETKNFGDISKIEYDKLPDFDLFTYSFPCQDISVAGEGRGLKQDSGTRSSLLWDCQDIIEAKKPKYLLMENVKNLVGKKHKDQFDKWLDILSDLGYTNYWQVLNAKDYGIPQNRERVFVVSILGEHKPYSFPEKKELKVKLKDLLLSDVDDKFYLTQEQIDRIKFTSYNMGRTRIQTRNYCDTLCARDYKDPKCVPAKIQQVGRLANSIWENPSRYRVYNSEGISPTLTNARGGGADPHIYENKDEKQKTPKVVEERRDEGLMTFKDGCVGTIRTINAGGDKRVLEPVRIKNATQKGYQEAIHGDIIDLAYPNSKTRRGRVKHGLTHTITTHDSLGVLETEPIIGASRGRNPENPTSRKTGLPTEQRLEINEKGTSNCITTVQKDNLVVYRGVAEYEGEVVYIRKLTPQECWRLMGIDDKDFFKAQEVNSNTQLYKQAGNAIVVDVLEGIFEKLYMKKECKSGSYK